MVRDERVLTVQEAFRAVLADPAWLKKTGIAMAVVLIPYVGAVWLMGYGLTYLRRAAWDTASALPEWRDAGSQLKTGLYGFVVGLVYSLPLSLITSIFVVALSMGGVFAFAEASDPTLLYVAIAIGTLVFTAITLAYALFLYPVYVHVSLHDRFESGFEIKRVIAIVKEHSPAFWTAWLRSMLLMLLSMCAYVGVFAVATGIGVAIGAGGAALVTDEMLPVVVVVSLIAEVAVGALAWLAQALVGFVNYRLWASYARVAYALDRAGA